MSNRDSMGFGDLLPQDVVQIFNEEKHGKRGHKKRSHSLGRALGWLKGRKRKELGANGKSLGLGPALDLALEGHHGGHRGGHRAGRPAHSHGNSHALPKRDDDDKTPAPLVVQENVFIEASRPKHLEDLHTEALEGLKMMQEEELNVPPPAETNYGMEFQDNESTISTRTVQTEGEGGGFMTDSTIADTTSVVSVQSSASTRSSRSGLTRQGSTFRPLNSGKKSEKTKRRRQRKTVVGIPQHVQRELGLDRVDWKLTQTMDEEQLYNGDTDNSPTTEGPQQAESQKGDNSGLRHKEFNHAGHRDDLDLLPRSGPDFSDGQRPLSLAVPWMTTANSLQQEPPSPVMSMSPQAPYMSKIIHNAVLPPSIDVVEISSRRSRSSLRTVSKSSLLLSSPTPSRPSSRASSSRNTSSRASNITSASRYDPRNQSDSSCWSNSESSDTLVSDSSTISSSSTPRQKKSQEGDSSSKKDKVSLHSISKASGCNSNGRLISEVDAVKKGEPFARSLSVIRPKKAPPPPSRSYSLHNKMKRRSRDLAEVRVIAGESSLHRVSTMVEENDKNDSGPFPMPSSTVDSPGYNADTSSLDDSTGSVSFSPLKSQPAKAEEAVKVDEKVPTGSSQEKQERKPSKIISPSSGYSSQDATSPQLCKPPHSSSPRHKRGILAKLQRLFPGSTSSAPSLPTQPEAPENDKSVSCEPVSITASVRTLRELFNIPPPPKVRAPPAPPPEVWAHSKRSFELLLGPPAPDNIYAIIKKNPKDRRQQRPPLSASADGSGKSLGVERKHKNPAVTAESMNGSPQVLEKRKVQESVILTAEFHKENAERLAQKVDMKEDGKVPEKGEKVGVSDILNGMLAKAVEKRQVRLAAAARDEEPNKTSTQTTEVKSVLPLVTSVTSVRTAVSPESSWPPPPPPMTQVGVGKPDEIDFPLPPPPLFGQVALVMPVQVPPQRSIPGSDSCKTASVVSVVTTEAEPQESSSAQGIGPPPLNIPPPPPYTAPPPPVIAVSPPAIQKFCLPPKEISPPPPPTPPPPKEFSSPPPQVSFQAPKEFSPPPPPPPPLPKEVSSPPPPPPLIEVSPPPPPKEVSPPPPKVVSPPPPKELSPPPPKVVFPPPPKEVSPPPPKVVSPPPPKVVSPPPPKEVSPPPPKVVSPPPPKEVSPPPPKVVSPPPPKVVSPPPPKEVSPPPPKVVSPPPPKVVSPPPPKEVCPPPPKVVSPPPPKEVSPPPPKEVSPMVQDAAPPLVIKVSPRPSTVIPAPPTEEVAILSSQGIISQSSVEVKPVSELSPPESIPPPPPLPSLTRLSEQDIDIPQEDILHESEISLVSSNSILTPPLSVPPPPNTDGTTAHEVPPAEVSMPKAPETPPSPEKTQEPSPTVNIPLPVQGLTSAECESSTAKTENPSQELNSDCVVVEEPLPVVTPSLLQMVQLRSVNSSSPESSKAQEQSEATEITMRKQQPNNQVQISSANGEAPQKPIRRSLIIIATSPTSTSPPVIVTSPPVLPKSQSPVALSAASSTEPSPTKKSPPATAASPSMNLQEAIRLRTAARSKESPSSRLSLKSPTSPMDFQKSPRSPSSTASFIFSKSNKTVVIATRPVPEAKTSVQNKLEVSSVTKVVSEAESLKKAGKVPPPVAKKPKSKAKDSETSEATEQTAGQEAQQESTQGATEKTNGTSGPAEEGETSST